MADEPARWHDVLIAILDHPEKLALGFVLLAGFWRWIRELFHESKEDIQHETFVESLLHRLREAEQENKELRDELRKITKDEYRDQ